MQLPPFPRKQPKPWSCTELSKKVPRYIFFASETRSFKLECSRSLVSVPTCTMYICFLPEMFLRVFTMFYAVLLICSGILMNFV